MVERPIERQKRPARLVKSYNINNLIEVTVDAPARYVEYFDNEYARISRGPSQQAIPHVRLTVVERLAAGPHREMVFKGLFRFRYLVRGLETATPEIVFERHWLDHVYLTPLGAFIQGQLLEPLVYAKLLERDVLFMHAAGVAKHGKAYVFPAHGGTGKTTLSLSLARNGFDLLGDDLLMIDVRTGVVHPYARPLHLFTYNLRTMRVPFALRAAIRTKDMLRLALNTLTGQHFLIATRAHVEELMEVRFGQPSALHRLVFLRREGNAETVYLDTPEARRNAAEAIIASADLNESLYANVSDDGRTRECEMAVVMRLLERVPRLEFIKPREMDEADRSRLAATLSSGGEIIGMEPA
jgi:hypothetical protein